MNIIEKINIKLILLTIYIYIYINLGGAYLVFQFSRSSMWGQDFDNILSHLLEVLNTLFNLMYSNFLIFLLLFTFSFFLSKFFLKKENKLYYILFHILALPASFFGYFILVV